MTRMMLLGSAFALIVLAAGGGEPSRGDPPALVGPSAVVDHPASSAVPIGSAPHVAHWSNSGCLLDPDGYVDWPCGEDELELAVEGHALHVVHRNATYNCCPDDIVISLSVEGNLLLLTEEEILTMPCDCWCCYDVEATVLDLASGTYTVEFCWFDYETWELQCYVDEIVIPEGGGRPRGDPPAPVSPEDVAASTASALVEAGADPLPHVAECSDSGCLTDDDGDLYWPCGDDQIEFTVDGDTLHVLHENAAYNCCRDEIVISASVEGNLLRLTEEEIVPNPCYCICCYDVEATVIDLASGTYTVEFCWYDYDTNQIECYTDEIVIPGGGLPGRDDPPPVVVDPEAVVGSNQSVASEAPAGAVQPRIDDYSNSGCLEGPDGDWNQCEEDDEIELTVEGQTLHVLHSNATYNCCPDDIVISVAQEGDLLSLTEEEILTLPCYCICCYSVEATVVDLAPGTYTVEFCWYDYETDQIQCYMEEIVIPGGGGLPPRGDPPLVVVGPEDVAGCSQSVASEVPSEPLPPQIDDYSNSGCLLDDDGHVFWPCGDDEIELIVEGDTLHVLHNNATYNCCPDDIVISLSQEGNLLRLTEEEILTQPCWCICCYNVGATVVDLASGEYVVEFCWFDYETFETQCYVEEIEIP